MFRLHLFFLLLLDNHCHSHLAFLLVHYHLVALLPIVAYDHDGLLGGALLYFYMLVEVFFGDTLLLLVASDRLVA